MGTSQDTSSHWRRLLKLDEPLPKDFEKHLAGFGSSLRPRIHGYLGKVAKRDFGLKGIGIENLPDRAPFIIASNHSSSLDFPAIYLSLPKELRKDVVVMYTSFFDRIFPIKMAIKALIDSFSVELDGNFWQALSMAARVLKYGKIVYIAPEGQRSWDGKLLPFKVGVGALSVETGIPVVPAYVKGAHEALPRGTVIPKKHPISVSFGKLIDPSSFAEKKSERPAYEVYRDFTQILRKEIVGLSR
ncbi:MAG: lysophospholipid acyltransferase family protein [Candidatus Margulisiibacteriota bacterium]